MKRSRRNVPRRSRSRPTTPDPVDAPPESKTLQEEVSPPPRRSARARRPKSDSPSALSPAPVSERRISSEAAGKDQRKLASKVENGENDNDEESNAAEQPRASVAMDFSGEDGDDTVKVDDEEEDEEDESNTTSRSNAKRDRDTPSVETSDAEGEGDEPTFMEERQERQGFTSSVFATEGGKQGKEDEDMLRSVVVPAKRKRRESSASADEREELGTDEEGNESPLHQETRRTEAAASSSTLDIEGDRQAISAKNTAQDPPPRRRRRRQETASTATQDTESEGKALLAPRNRRGGLPSSAGQSDVEGEWQRSDGDAKNIAPSTTSKRKRRGVTAPDASDTEDFDVKGAAAMPIRRGVRRRKPKILELDDETNKSESTAETKGAARKQKQQAFDRTAELNNEQTYDSAGKNKAMDHGHDVEDEDEETEIVDTFHETEEPHKAKDGHAKKQLTENLQGETSEGFERGEDELKNRHDNIGEARTKETGEEGKAESETGLLKGLNNDVAAYDGIQKEENAKAHAANNEPLSMDQENAVEKEMEANESRGVEEAIKVEHSVDQEELKDKLESHHVSNEESASLTVPVANSSDNAKDKHDANEEVHIKDRPEHVSEVNQVQEAGHNDVQNDPEDAYADAIAKGSEVNETGAIPNIDEPMEDPEQEEAGNSGVSKEAAGTHMLDASKDGQASDHEIDRNDAAKGESMFAKETVSELNLHDQQHCDDEIRSNQLIQHETGRDSRWNEVAESDISDVQHSDGELDKNEVVERESKSENRQKTGNNVSLQDRQDGDGEISASEVIVTDNAESRESGVSGEMRDRRNCHDEELTTDAAAVGIVDVSNESHVDASEVEETDRQASEEVAKEGVPPNQGESSEVEDVISENESKKIHISEKAAESYKVDEKRDKSDDVEDGNKLNDHVDNGGVLESKAVMGKDGKHSEPQPFDTCTKNSEDEETEFYDSKEAHSVDEADELKVGELASIDQKDADDAMQDVRITIPLKACETICAYMSKSTLKSEVLRDSNVKVSEGRVTESGLPQDSSTARLNDGEKPNPVQLDYFSAEQEPMGRHVMMDEDNESSEATSKASQAIHHSEGEIGTINERSDDVGTLAGEDSTAILEKDYDAGKSSVTMGEVLSRLGEGVASARARVISKDNGHSEAAPLPAKTEGARSDSNAEHLSMHKDTDNAVSRSQAEQYAVLEIPEREEIPVIHASPGIMEQVLNEERNEEFSTMFPTYTSRALSGMSSDLGPGNSLAEKFKSQNVSTARPGDESNSRGDNSRETISEVVKVSIQRASPNGVKDPSSHGSLQAPKKISVAVNTDDEPSGNANPAGLIEAITSSREKVDFQQNIFDNRRMLRSVQVGKAETTLNQMKIRIYSAGMRAHPGQSGETLFACYWSALCRCFGTRLHDGGLEKRSCMMNGTRQVIKKFLTTKSLRRLHNALILGLLSRCTDDVASAEEIAKCVPTAWKKRVQLLDSEFGRPAFTFAVPGNIPAFEANVKSEYDSDSVLWTGSGILETFSTPPADSKLSLCLDKAPSEDVNSSPLPGALHVDPFVRAAAQKEGLKVAENAVWLVMVGMREYVKSILKNTVATVVAVNEDDQLPNHLALIGSIGPVAKDRQFEKARSEVAFPESGKRKCLSALDLASYLMSSPVTSGRSSNRLAFEELYLAAFDPLLVTSQSGFDSLQGFIASGIEASKPKRQKVDKDSSFLPPSTKPSQQQSQPQNSCHKKCEPAPLPAQITENQATPVDSVSQPKESSSKAVLTVKPPHPTSLRRSPSIRGMGRGAKNLAALKERAAAAASAAKDDDALKSEASADKEDCKGNQSNQTTPKAAPTVEQIDIVKQDLFSRDQEKAIKEKSVGESASDTMSATAAVLAQSTEVQTADTKNSISKDAHAKDASSGVAVLEPAKFTSIVTSVAQLTEIQSITSVRKEYMMTATSSDSPTKATHSGSVVVPAAQSTNVQLTDSNYLLKEEVGKVSKSPAQPSLVLPPASRGGRGFGVKNLAIMRARSTGNTEETTGGSDQPSVNTGNESSGTSGKRIVDQKSAPPQSRVSNNEKRASDGASIAEDKYSTSELSKENEQIASGLESDESCPGPDDVKPTKTPLFQHTNSIGKSVENFSAKAGEANNDNALLKDSSLDGIKQEKV